MSKDIKKALKHCIDNECVGCPNNEELGSGDIVCRGRLLPDILEYISDLQHRLEVAEKALELACDCIPCKECPYSDGKSYCYLASEIEDEPNNWECNTTKYSHYLEQAEKEIKGEKE